MSLALRYIFWPAAHYFDSLEVFRPRLQHLLRAKAVLCPGLQVYSATSSGEELVWHYKDGLGAYLSETLERTRLHLIRHLLAKYAANAMRRIVGANVVGGRWRTACGSYPRLIPTVQGATLMACAQV